MAEQPTSQRRAPAAASPFDQDAAPFAPVSFRRSFRLRSWFFPVFLVCTMTTEWVLGDHLLVVRCLAGIGLFVLAAAHLQDQLAETSADGHGVWRRYGWLTSRLGWQQHWRWSDVASVSCGGQGVTFRTTRGRTVQLVGPLFSSRDDARLRAFAGRVEALAVLAGVPVVAPPTWRERWAEPWRPGAAR